jgi:chromosomal replication initiation ATPase DnaA
MRLDPRLVFDRLVIGAGNRMAAAAARAVAEAPGTTYNPLFIYGGSGLGKTHLLTATGHRLQELQPEAEVVAMTLDDFAEQWHAAVSAGETQAFGGRLGRVDLLLLDDIQFLAGRREMQAELLRLFTAMQDSGRQIVCTSDRPPTEIADVDERLIQRLSGGLVVDVSAPEYEARVAILRAACAERGVEVPDEVLDELAEPGVLSVRELQGALNQWIARQALGDRRTRSLTPFAGDMAALQSSGEFLSFLSDVTSVVQQHVESWQVRLREVIAYWQGEGYRTAVLERALALPKDPDVPALIAVYVQAVEHLRALETQATGIERALGGHELFRDPERLAEAEQLVERAVAGEVPPGGPSAAFTRAGFEVGSANQLAVHAADAVIASPGTRYNPLLVTGTSGVGKTHLVHAIGNAIAEASGGRIIVACVHAQTLVDELIVAIQQGTVERWRARYRSAGALIVDDVQFLSGKERTQDEFFFVFNALVEEGKQIILSSDRPASEIPELAARLRSRFEGGLTAEIQLPDRPLREKLVARFLASLGRPATPDLLDVIGDPPVRSVRELIGVVNRLAAAADARGGTLDAALARVELGLGASATATMAPAATAEAAGDRTFLDRERVVWDWPDIGGRLIEELG